MTNVTPIREVPDILGPKASGHSVIVDGRVLPIVTAREEGEEMWFCVDNRFGVGVPKDYAHSVAWIIGQAMAVAMGYASLSADSKDRPFAPQIHKLGE